MARAGEPWAAAWVRRAFRGRGGREGRPQILVSEKLDSRFPAPQSRRCRSRSSASRRPWPKSQDAKAYVVLGGEGWKLRQFYTTGGLKKDLNFVDSVEVVTLEGFVSQSQPREALMARTQDTQRAAFKFLLARFQSQQPFTKQELQQASGWSANTLKVYLSKQLGDLLENVTGTTYRVSEIFAAYNTWPKFRTVVSQKRRLVTDYRHERTRASWSMSSTCPSSMR